MFIIIKDDKGNVAAFEEFNKDMAFLLNTDEKIIKALRDQKYRYSNNPTYVNKCLETNSFYDEREII